MELAIYDSTFDLKSVLPFLTDGYYLPMESISGKRKFTAMKVETIFFFGSGAEFSKHYTIQDLIFVSPLPSLHLPDNTKKVYYKKFVDKVDSNLPCSWEYY